MESPLIHEIITSLESLNILELRNLTDALSEKYISVTVIDEAEIRRREAEERAYWTPSYSLKLVRVELDPEDTDKKVALIKTLRLLNPEFGLKKAKEIVEDTENLPRTVRTIIDEHPSDARKMLQPVREALEALGAVFDEDYNYGYYD